MGTWFPNITQAQGQHIRMWPEQGREIWWEWWIMDLRPWIDSTNSTWKTTSSKKLLTFCWENTHRPLIWNNLKWEWKITRKKASFLNSDWWMPYRNKRKKIIRILIWPFSCIFKFWLRFFFCICYSFYLAESESFGSFFFFIPKKCPLSEQSAKFEAGLLIFNAAFISISTYLYLYPSLFPFPFLLILSTALVSFFSPLLCFPGCFCRFCRVRIFYFWVVFFW